MFLKQAVKVSDSLKIRSCKGHGLQKSWPIWLREWNKNKNLNRLLELLPEKMNLYLSQFKILNELGSQNSW